jgi:ribosomal protein S18 acetylase RimI-like enzyme
MEDIEEPAAGDSLRLAGLRPIRVGDRPIFDAALSTISQPISDETFAGTFMWSGALRMAWGLFDEHVCVFANSTGDLTMMLPPLPLPGASPAALASATRTCFEIMDDYNAARGASGRSQIEYVSDEALERFAAAPHVRLSATPIWSDYIYRTPRMIDLAGGDLKSKRGARTRFLRTHPDATLEEFSPDRIEACAALLEQWGSHSDAKHEGEVNDCHVGSDVLRRRDLDATRMMLHHVCGLSLAASVLRAGDEILGFSIGERLSPMQGLVLIEKTRPGVEGASQFLFSEFCRLHFADLPEVNVGDDWGIPSLRFTKQSYRPLRLLHKSILTHQPTPMIIRDAIPDAGLIRPAHAVGGGSAEPENGASMSVMIRRASLSDLGSLFSLETDCFETLEERFTRRQVARLLKNPRALTFIAEREGQPLGWAIALIRRHRVGRSGRLYSLAVAPNARGAGVGRALAGAVLSALAEAGLERCFLEVRAENTPAIRLYEALGFTPIATLPDYYAAGRNAVRMRRVASTRGADVTESRTGLGEPSGSLHSPPHE